MQPEFTHLMNQERHADLLREATARRRGGPLRLRFWRRGPAEAIAGPVAPTPHAPAPRVPAQVKREVLAPLESERT
jgi:hypothetical protein